MSRKRPKCELSTVRETEINLPFIISTGRNEALHLQTSLTREKLEELTRDLIDRTIEICAQTLRDAEVSESEVEDVILVGGHDSDALRPRIRRRVLWTRAVQRSAPRRVLSPSEPRSRASHFSTIRPRSSSSTSRRTRLGLMIVGGYFHKLIEQNTTVPTSKSHVFTTVKDNQTSVKILVLQGESDRAEENELLGEFILTGLRRAPRAEVEVEVTFSISADGIVSVTAKDLETGLEQSITVTATSGLTEDEIRGMIDANEDYMVDLRSTQDFERYRHDAETHLREIDELFPEVSRIISGSDFGQDAVKKARGVCERTRQAIGAKDGDKLQELNEALSRTLNMFRGVVSKTRAG